MHLFEGAVLAVRNPGGHAFPEGPEQRAIEYISIPEPPGLSSAKAKVLRQTR